MSKTLYLYRDCCGRPFLRREYCGKEIRCLRCGDDHVYIAEITKDTKYEDMFLEYIKYDDVELGELEQYANIHEGKFVYEGSRTLLVLIDKDKHKEGMQHPLISTIGDSFLGYVETREDLFKLAINSIFYEDVSKILEETFKDEISNNENKA